MGNVKLNGYLTSIIHKEGVKKQFKFEAKLLKQNGTKDPLNEKRFTKAKGLIHRYPDRVVLTITNQCFVYCNFCFRKHNWEEFEGFDLNEAENYIRNHPSIREVLISGGDPLTLSNRELENILKRIKDIPNIKIIRIGSRVLTAFPQRIDEKLINILRKYLPLWFAIHINHPDEITELFKTKARMLIETGITIVSQTVLLKEINDNSHTLEELFCKLVEIGIKPYYLFGCDQAEANEDYRVSIDKALRIMEDLRFRISGLCMPVFAFDLPEGGGKVVLEPDRIIKRVKNRYIFRNFEGRKIPYEDV
ncbi:KamA family radical SAM protein [Hippea alviniae]|uniref:KamA family radical SAM protein n=1 Tax=Hippea alviniae TaxID=1279027 RepID=UPI0003B4D858|nr:KamA family radical SAM protein [Hippea alviniae]